MKPRKFVMIMFFLVGLAFATPCAVVHVKASADPIRRAKIAVAELANWQEKFENQLAAVHEAVGTLKTVPAWDSTANADDVRELIAILRKPATWLIDNREDTELTMLSYEASLERSATAMEGAAQQYREYAQEYPEDQVHHQHYLVLAEHSLEAAKQMRVRKGALQKDRQDLAGKSQFVQETLLYMDRLEMFLDYYPADQTSAKKIEFYLKQLQDYMDAFEAMAQLFDVMSEGLPRENQGDAS